MTFIEAKNCRAKEMEEALPHEWSLYIRVVVCELYGFYFWGVKEFTVTNMGFGLDH